MGRYLLGDRLVSLAPMFCLTQICFKVCSRRADKHVGEYRTIHTNGLSYYQ
jgi:hypothetical protein